jgi:rfaE bifunctional protein nucleotidyltransferase chain/domain
MHLLLAHDELSLVGKTYRKQAKKLVLTNGCFDLLHTGHVRYLQAARALGDALIVAINSDRSVRELKGPTRPLNSEEDRAEVIAALRCVDGVTIFDDLRVSQVIKELHPAIYAKGGDYTIDSLNESERQALQECDAKIHILPLVPGRSTTSLFEKTKGIFSPDISS